MGNCRPYRSRMPWTAIRFLSGHMLLRRAHSSRNRFSRGAFIRKPLGYIDAERLTALFYISYINTYHHLDVLEAFCILLLRITSFAIICAEISCSKLFNVSDVGRLLAGTLTNRAVPPLLLISLLNMLLMLMIITSLSCKRFCKSPTSFRDTFISQNLCHGVLL